MAQKKILYVEDEPFLAKIVKETLELKGFEVLHIADGHSVYGKFEAFDPHICILDVMLPGKDGFSIGKEIRKGNNHIPIIYLTAKDQTSDLIKGFSAGGNDYIKKPFSMEELIVRVENLLQLKSNDLIENKTINTYKLGKLTFNALSMELKSDDQRIQLSHRESEILKLLCINMNNQLERKEILLKIWGDDSFFNSRNLDVYIRKIRKYLSLDPSIQLLTLKGIGYRLFAE